MFFTNIFFIPFVLYELIPTKLPHYVFPSYAALSILISKEIINYKFDSSLLSYAFLPVIILPLTILVVITFAINEYSSFDNLFFFIVSILMVLFLILLYFLKKKQIKSILFIAFNCIKIFVYLVAVYYLVPQLNSFWISQNINKVVDQYVGVVDEIFHFGFNEPSLVFLTSHKAKQKMIGKEDKNKKILFFVERKFENSIKENIELSNFKLVDQIKGFNYSQGKNKIINIYANF